MDSSFNFSCLKLRRLAWKFFDKKSLFYTKKYLIRLAIAIKQLVFIEQGCFTLLASENKY